MRLDLLQWLFKITVSVFYFILLLFKEYVFKGHCEKFERAFKMAFREFI